MTTLTAATEDWAQLGLEPPRFFRLVWAPVAIVADAETDVVQSAASVEITSTTGTIETEIPEPDIGRGIWIDTNIDGLEKLWFSAYPTDHVTLVDLLQHYVVDGETLEPTEDGTAAWELVLAQVKAQVILAQQAAGAADGFANSAEASAFFADLSANEADESETSADGSATAAMQSSSDAATALAQVLAAIAGFQVDLSLYQVRAEKAQPGGYASLDGGGKIPVSQLPAAVMSYLGLWNAATNTPVLSDASGDQGDLYIVSAGGTQNLGSGPISVDSGDWMLYNGTRWEKSDQTDSVTSVAGKRGAVVLVKSDVGLDQVDNTSDMAKPISTAVQAVLNATIDGGRVDDAGNLILHTVAGGEINAGFVRGPAGPANTLAIGSVTKLAPGSLPTATITGASPNQTLALGLVDGDDGLQGPGGDVSPSATSNLAGATALPATSGTQTLVLNSTGSASLTLSAGTAGKSYTISVLLNVTDPTHSITLPPKDATHKYEEGVIPIVPPAVASHAFNYWWTGTIWVCDGGRLNLA